MSFVVSMVALFSALVGRSWARDDGTGGWPGPGLSWARSRKIPIVLIGSPGEKPSLGANPRENEEHVMFGWFGPTSPCDPAAKRWVEDRLRWLSRQFGLHLLLERPIILPTSEFFPDPWDGSPRAVRRMFRRVCQYLQVDPDAVELKLFTDRTPDSMVAIDPTRGFAAGTWQGREQPWQKGVVRIERSALDRPTDLVGTMAHELAHQRLLGEGRADPEAYDNELLTDLTAVYHGFGVFLANNPRKSAGELGYWPGTQLRRPEYLSEPMLGYALAHIAWFRDEDSPAWSKHLRWAPRAVFGQGLRYLRRTGDSTFRPVRLERSRHEAGEG